jgi:hypothetical protein
MIFLDNKYTNWYFNIVANAKQTAAYTEKHHIVPRSLGGSNDKSNIIKLSAREHFICHWLLSKMCAGNERNKMVYALFMMKKESKQHQRYFTPITSRVFEKYKSCLRHSDETKQKMRKPKSQVHCNNISKARQGIAFSDQQIHNMSIAHKGIVTYKRTDKHREITRNIHKNKVVSEESRKKMSESHIGKSPGNKGVQLSVEQKALRPWHHCSICGTKSQNKANIVRYHGNNCKNGSKRKE